MTDIVVEEVSIVDRPANQRPFLVVKRADPDDVSGDVVMNEDGELVMTTVGDDVQKQRIAAAQKQLVQALEAGDDDAIDAAMDALNKARSYTDDDDDKSDDKDKSDDDKRDGTKKAGAKMSKERFDKLLAAIDTLISLKDSLTPETGPTAGSAQTRKKDDDGGATNLLADVTKRMDTLASSIGKLHEVVTDQEKRIRSNVAKASKRDETVRSNRIAVEKGRRPRQEAPTAWPMDMNREETPANTPAHRSFFDD